MKRLLLALAIALGLSSGPSAAEEARTAPRLRIGRPAFRLRGTAVDVAWSPKGRRIGTAGHGVTVLSARTGATLWFERGRALRLVFAPGRHRVAHLSDRRMLIRDADSGLLLRSLGPGKTRLLSLAWSPDGRFIATGSARGELQLLDLRSAGALRSVTDQEGELAALAFSPDGDRLATAGQDGRIRIRKVSDLDHPRVIEGTGQPIRALAWSRDERCLASAGGDRFVTLRDGVTGKETGRLVTARPARNSQGVDRLSFSPDRKRLVVTGRSGRLTVWDVEAGTLVREYRRSRHTTGAAAFSPDGTRIASAWGAVLSVRDAATGAMPETFRGHEAAVTALAFSPDRKVLAAGDRAGNVHLWDAATGEEIRRFRAHHGDVLQIAWGGTLLATTGEDGKARTWRIADAKPVAELPKIDPNHGAVAFSPKADFVAVDRGVCDPQTGKVIAWFHEASVNATDLVWSADGARILLSGNVRRGGCGVVVDAKSGRLLLNLPNVVNRQPVLFWAEKGTRIVGRGNGVEVIWNARTGEEISSKTTTWRRPGSPLAWSRSGRCLLQGDLSVIDLATDRVVQRMDPADLGNVSAIAWSADGRVVAAGTRQGRIGIYDRSE